MVVSPADAASVSGARSSSNAGTTNTAALTSTKATTTGRTVRHHGDLGAGPGSEGEASSASHDSSGRSSKYGRTVPDSGSGSFAASPTVCTAAFTVDVTYRR